MGGAVRPAEVAACGQERSAVSRTGSGSGVAPGLRRQSTDTGYPHHLHLHQHGGFVLHRTQRARPATAADRCGVTARCLPRHPRAGRIAVIRRDCFRCCCRLYGFGTTGWSPNRSAVVVDRTVGRCADPARHPCLHPPRDGRAARAAVSDGVRTPGTASVFRRTARIDITFPLRHLRASFQCGQVR